MNDERPSLATVLNYVNSFHEQCRNMARDTVRLLRDNHQLYLAHRQRWDFAAKPNDHFLTQDCSSVRRAWTTFVPSGDSQRGAIFVFDFFRPHKLVIPSLIYGAAYAGSDGFDSGDRWATYNVIVDAEKGDQAVTVRHDGPIAIVTGAMPKRFEESAMVRVPLEAITDQDALEKMVVEPLAALLHGERATAIDLLTSVPTEVWPSIQAGSTEEEEDDSEQA